MTPEPRPPELPRPAEVPLIQSPPHTWLGILSRLGPGMIIAGSIVGSGELIGTTKTGAEAGFHLLWLIVLGCVIKVFAQVEFGRYAIAEGRTSLEGMNELPGPRLRANWLLWYWVLMFSLGLGQLGGIVGSVGQALATSFPITGDFAERITAQRQQFAFDAALSRELRAQPAAPDTPNTPTSEDAIAARQRQAAEAVSQRLGPRPELPTHAAPTRDDGYWSAIVTLITAVLLVQGRYSLVQNVSAILVASFTAITVFNVVALQLRPDWAIGWRDLASGLNFSLPPAQAGRAPVATALATFGIIGVGASELIAYPYWCLEKGYARYCGPRDTSPAWADRARGWLRVLHWDAWCSMAVYTFATVAFYLQGAAILHRAGLNPAKNAMLATLVEMYVPVFGPWAQLLFLCGAFAVLYSTFFVASAGNARMCADALRVFRLIDGQEATQWRWVRIGCAVFPFVSLAIYILSRDPVTLVLISGLAQSIMLPMLGAAALFFRYRRCDARIMPGKAWDLLLWISVLGLLVAGLWGATPGLTKLLDVLQRAVSG